MTPRIWTHLSAALCLVALGAVAEAYGTTGDKAPGREEAVALYDAGRFAEARSVIEELDQRGAADGALLYRLYFCLGAAGEREAAVRMLQRARLALEAENASAGNLEVPFYLANTYTNLGLRSEAQAVARAATDRVESGALAGPQMPMDFFRLAKLYQDQGRRDRAASLFEQALSGFEQTPEQYGANMRWARRYLAETAFSAAEFERAEREYAKLVALEPASADDLSALAVARVRIGRYADAADAWREAVRRDPADADDPRYASRLATIAAEIPALPKTASSGQGWGQLTQDELEAVLRDTASEVKELRAEALKLIEAGGGDQDARARFDAAAAAARGRFVAAGLEYACRRLPIRETAFREGYAVLIFQPGPWEWPEPPAAQK